VTNYIRHFTATTLWHVEISICVWKSHSECINHTCLCWNHTPACWNHTLRSEMSLVRVTITCGSRAEVGKSLFLSIWYSRGTQMRTSRAVFFYNFHWNNVFEYRLFKLYLLSEILPTPGVVHSGMCSKNWMHISWEGGDNYSYYPHNGSTPAWTSDGHNHQVCAVSLKYNFKEAGDVN
jgi:hypothetical protein